MKPLAKKVIVGILGWQVKRLRRKNDFKVVGVVGSIGKTSTKFAIATVLKQSKLKVRFQEGNYNDLVTVPLVFFGEDAPSLFNPIAWLTTLVRNERQIRKPYPYQVVVAEVGTDYPGNIVKFGQYLHCDMTVVTAITSEHMEFFRDLDDVANEELSAGTFSDELIVNTDFCDAKYLAVPNQVTSFGTGVSNYQITDIQFKNGKADFALKKGGQHWLKGQLEAVAKSEVYSATAAAVVADKLGVESSNITKAVTAIKPVSGRMQRLKGIHNSTILDETYNASPEAVKAALDSLYEFDAPQKIAVLGNMNELGKFSPDAHAEIGKYCDAKQLGLVVTIGPDANEYLAPAAVEQGCLVKTFTDPYSAGEFVKSQIQVGAVVLVKGSQNKVYAEETVKLLLADSKDAERLVRQSPDWMAKKKANFKTS